MGYLENYDAATTDPELRARVRMALIAQAMERADPATPDPSAQEQALIRRLVDEMDEGFLTELLLALIGSFNLAGVSDAQIDAHINTQWPRLIAGFSPLAAEPAP